MERFSPWNSFAELPPNRRRRYTLITASVIIVVLLLYFARDALFPFVIGGILSYILLPAVRWMEKAIPWRWRREFPVASRIAAISVIYLAVIGILAGIVALILPPALQQTSELLHNLPSIYSDARQAVEDFTAEFSQDIPDSIQLQIEGVFAQFGDLLLTMIQTAITGSLSTVADTLRVIIGLAIVPVLLFYLLKDGERIIGGFYGLFPKNIRVHCVRIGAMVSKSLGAYIRAQLTLMLFVGLFVFVGLTLLGIDFAVLLGLTAGITESVPIVGPIIGAVPGIVVTLATAPDKVIWAVALYLGTQLVENYLLVPRIQGRAVNMHPIVIMALLIIASETFGIIGILAAVPVGSIARDVFWYLYRTWSDHEQPVPLERAAENPDTSAMEPRQELSS